VRLHAVVRGEGPPLLLVHGWPESWYAWRLVIPALAQDFRIVAVDQRGMGLSDKPQDGYDAATLANDLIGVMDALGHDPFAAAGHDTGMVIAYALAADHRDRIDRLVVGETTRPGVGPSQPFIVPAALNDILWHIAVNRLKKVNEQLIEGREDIYFGFDFEHRTVKKLPQYALDHYIEHFAASREALRGSFEFYRAVDATTAQHTQRMTQRLTLPVLAIGGGASSGEGPANAMKLAADNVEALGIPDCGHFVAEEAPTR
jgi:pimeloyl-ACP methyl ester carboxylesterase